jgi:hypothetical protein
MDQSKSEHQWTPLNLDAHEARLRSPEWISLMQSIFSIHQKQDLLDFIDSFDGVAYIHGITPTVSFYDRNQYALKHPVTKKILWTSPLFCKGSPLEYAIIVDAEHMELN